MGKLLFTENIRFLIKDWEKTSINKVYAGANYIIAVTENGTVLNRYIPRKNKNNENHYQTKSSKLKDFQILSSHNSMKPDYYSQFKQIAVSKVVPGAAIGLTNSGICICDSRDHHAWVYEEVDTWRDRGDIKIVQVAASDCFFALDSKGHVHHAYLYVMIYMHAKRL